MHGDDVMRLAGRAMDGWSDDPGVDGVVYP